MKTCLLFIIGLFMSITTGHAQQNKALSSSEVVWYGLDFTKARMIGSLGFTDPDDIADRFLKNWNQLIISENEKYDIAKFYSKKEVHYNIEMTNSRNEKIDADKLVIDEDYEISKDDITSVISEYEDGDHTAGLGLVYIIESFNKIKGKGNIWVTFFDIASGEVIHTEKMEGKPGGFGLKNYWARTVYDVMKKCKKEFKKW